MRRAGTSLALLIASLAASGCKQQSTFVLVRVEAGAATPAGVMKIDLMLQLDGKTAMRTLQEKAPHPITLPTTASEEVTTHEQGRVVVTATALDSSGQVVDDGSAEGMVATGKVITVVVRLGTHVTPLDGGVVAAVDLAGGTDLGSGDDLPAPLEAGAPCNSAADCDDANPCTTDTCDPTNGCQHAAISCDDGNACTDDTCDPASGCQHATTSCDDHNVCTLDSCAPATGCAHVDSSAMCDDGNGCTTDTCDPQNGCKHSAPTCDDSNACTTDSCVTNTCHHVAVNCDDANPCTADSCVPATGCKHVANPGMRVGTPDPSSVFNTIEQTYYFTNNLVDSIWHHHSNLIITGDFSAQGYYSFPPGTTNYDPAPTNAKTGGVYGRMVQMPGTNTVVHTTVGNMPAAYNQIMAGTINATTGALGTFTTVTFSDNYTGNCDLISSSYTQFLCYDGTNVRVYDTTAGSSTLTFNKNVALTPNISGVCSSYCWAGTFAWDGLYYYFATSGTSGTTPAYQVYDSTGAHYADYAATGSANISGVYFDWSVARYSTHDGVGTRSGGSTYHTSVPTSDSDTNCFSPVSTNHCPAP